MHKWVKGLPWLLLVMALTACGREPTPPTRAEAPVATTAVSLTLHGYNYTDYYIHSFEVNGQGGGNLYVSTPTSGGGGSVCCVSWWPGTKLPKKFKIRWVADFCMEKRKTHEGEVFEQTHSIWKEAEVMLTEPPPPKPENFEVHFYRDGKIEVAITDDYSPPRLKLETANSARRFANDIKNRRCTDAELKKN